MNKELEKELKEIKRLLELNFLLNEYLKNEIGLSQEEIDEACKDFEEQEKKEQENLILTLYENENGR